MIVLCVGMYRSCSTWQYGVASLILERHRNGRRIGFIDGPTFVEKAVADRASAGWQVMKAHDAHPCFDEILHEGRALGIFAHRDIRDVALSWMHMTDASFEDIIAEGGFLELCLDNDRFWRHRPGVLVQTYEAIVSEPANAVAEIAAHVGVRLDDDEAQAIADEMSREANRKRIEKLNDKLRSEGTELLPQDLSLFDPASLLHWNHIRDGRTGLWRESFSPEQCRALAPICGRWLIERGYEADLQWAGISGQEAAAESSLPRVSYAPNAEDIRLDRIFRGRTGLFLDINAGHPTRDNASFFFHLRGWTGINVEAPGADHGRFRAERPADLNLTIRLSDADAGMAYDEAGVPMSSTRALAGLIDQYRLGVPDIVLIGEGAEVAPILRGMPLDRWQPRVFVVAGPASAHWTAPLADRGYIDAATDGVNRFFLRADLEAAVPLVQAPINSRDRFEMAETARLRDECQRLLAEVEAEKVKAQAGYDHMARERDEALIRLMHERDAAVATLSHERDVARNEVNQLTPVSERRLADLIQLQNGLAAVQAARLAEQAAHHAERERMGRELAEAAARAAEQLARVEAERDDLRSDCATWESEASRRARLAIQERAAREKAEALHAEDRARHAAECERFDRERARFERERERFEAQMAGWNHERAGHETRVVEYQRQLRPYRLLDRLGVVGAIHQQARKVKRSARP
ncbi:sulfotransferase domain-containing protein [Tundrisphaera sp. TA3]|uniref:sulfotransferase domain-containing protein n=1 Tax=Tundrisphaera sp. TA3 TaxID=3435775 RepID=UPI003EBCAE41